MKKIIFVCHGNICRSPAAEYIMKSLTKDFEICSRATSFEEIGNDIYPPMKKELFQNSIPFNKHYATRITREDFENADYIFYMDGENEYALNRMFGQSNKIMPIYKFTPNISEIEDPWYSDRFDLVVRQITTCIKDIIKNIN